MKNYVGGRVKNFLEKKHVQGCQISGFLVLFIKIHDGGGFGKIWKKIDVGGRGQNFFVSCPPYNAKWNSPGMKN